MAAVMFGLILHFQYAYGWSPVVAGLANLPMILTMLAAQPISELLARRHGHRIACVVGGAAGRVAGPICAVALVDATPANRTSIGTALNDTAQEIGDEEDTEPAPQPAG